MIQVDLDRIFAGKDPDFYIRRGDVVNVGTHPLAPFLQRIRAYTLPSPANTAGYSFTYSRNFADIDSYGAKITRRTCSLGTRICSRRMDRMSSPPATSLKTPRTWGSSSRRWRGCRC